MAKNSLQIIPKTYAAPKIEKKSSHVKGLKLKAIRYRYKLSMQHDGETLSDLLLIVDTMHY